MARESIPEVFKGSDLHRRTQKFAGADWCDRWPCGHDSAVQARWPEPRAIFLVPKVAVTGHHQSIGLGKAIEPPMSNRRALGQTM